MMTGKLLLSALAGVSLVSLVASPAAAQSTQPPQDDGGTSGVETSRNQTFLDLQAGIGYSSNPELRVGGVGSAFGRVSAFGFHGWGGERSSSSISGYVENSTYFRRYGNKQLFSLNANNATKISEKVTVFGNVGFSGDFGAQLSSRFFGAPTYAVPTDPTIPDTTVIVVTPDLLALSQRQYRINGSVGTNVLLTPRDSVSATFGAQRVFYSGNSGASLDYNMYDASASYRRQVNERLGLGVRGIISKADYSLDRTIVSYGPQITADLQLAENLQLGGAIGFVRTERDFGVAGSWRNSTDLALDASLCRSLEYERFCGRVSRRTQSASIGAAQTATSLVGDYSRRLNARDQFQASIAIVTTDGLRELGLGRQNLYSLSGSFDRRISQRLSAGVSASARTFSIPGTDPKADIGGSIFIRNRLGSIR